MASPNRSIAVNTPGSPSTAARPQVYQIDFTAVASGKRIASTKRRVRWRFGFANPEALANGETGTACRGEEHDVTIVWSITSGKRLVLADGQEVHYTNSRNNVFDFSWTMRGNHVLKVVAHASPPISAQPGFRQYDFFVDGQSFFTFPKVYRLGLSANDPRAAASPHSPPSLADRSRNYNTSGGGSVSVRSNGQANIAVIEAPHNPDEEEAYLREAIKNSLKESANPADSAASVKSAPAAPAPAGDNLLLDFFGSPAPSAPALPPPSPAPAMPSYASLPPPASDPFGSGASSVTQPAFAALPPSTSAPPQANGHGNPADPWGAPAAAPTPAAPAPYGQPAPAPAAPFGAPAAYGQPAGMSYGMQNGSIGGTAPVPAPDYAASAPAPYGMPQQYGQQSTQPPPQQTPTANGSANPAFTPGTETSSIGFASPVGYSMPGGQNEAGMQQSFAQQPISVNDFAQHPAAAAPEPAPTEPEVQVAPEPTAAAAPSDPALFSMNVLSGQPQSLLAGDTSTDPSKSMADQAYAKLVNMDAFDLVKDRGEESRYNPFETTQSDMNSNLSLADMKKSQPTQKKEVMRSNPGAMVVSSSQQGNFGGYGAQYGLGQQQPQMQQGGYGMQQSSMQQQPQYGQQPPPMQQFGQQPPQQQYGQPSAPQYGQQQQQQPQYGQPPPLQQQFGGQPQYGQQAFGGF